QAFMKHEGQGVQLKAPPGPAVLVWDSIERKPEVRHLDELPENCKPLTDAEKKSLNIICTEAKPLEKGTLGSVLDQGVTAAEPLQRKAAVTMMGAVDDLPRLLTALSSKHVDVRDQA